MPSDIEHAPTPPAAQRLNLARFSARHNERTRAVCAGRAALLRGMERSDGVGDRPLNLIEGERLGGVGAVRASAQADAALPRRAPANVRGAAVASVSACMPWLQPLQASAYGRLPRRVHERDGAARSTISTPVALPDRRLWRGGQKRWRVARNVRRVPARRRAKRGAVRRIADAQRAAAARRAATTGGHAGGNRERLERKRGKRCSDARASMR